MAKKIRKVRALSVKDRIEASQERRSFPPLPLKPWFKLAGVKQRHVAEAINLDESQLSLVRSGKRPYLRTHLEDMAVFLSTKAEMTITPDMLLLPPGEPSIMRVIARLDAAGQRRAARTLEAALLGE